MKVLVEYNGNSLTRVFRFEDVPVDPRYGFGAYHISTVKKAVKEFYETSTGKVYFAETHGLLFTKHKQYKPDSSIFDPLFSSTTVEVSRYGRLVGKGEA